MAEYKREGKPCKSAAYVGGLANCEQEQFWDAAYEELKREHSACDRAEEEIKILAYIR